MAVEVEEGEGGAVVGFCVGGVEEEGVGGVVEGGAEILCSFSFVVSLYFLDSGRLQKSVGNLRSSRLQKARLM